MKIKHLYVIFTLAFIIRLFAALYLGNTVSGLSGAHDEISYSMLGQRFVDGYGLTFPHKWYPWIDAGAPQSYYSATMSLFLAGIYTVFGYHPLVARIVMALLSALIVVLIVILAQHLFTKRAAIVSSIIAGGYAYLIFYGVTLVTETPFIFCILVALYLAYKLIEFPSTEKWFLLGLVLAIGILFRMAVIFFIPFLLGWILIQQPKQSKMSVLIPIGMISLAILPFAIRNYKIWGEFLLLEAQFGHVFWNGNHPDSLGNFHPHHVFQIPPEVLKSKNDVIITNTLMKMAIQNIVNDPRLFVSLTITRLREFFTFWPTTDSSTLANVLRVFSFGIMWPFAVAGLWISRGRWKALTPLYIFLIIHTGVYAISWTMIRYRIPMDVILIIFAGVAIDNLYQRLIGRKMQVSS